MFCRSEGDQLARELGVPMLHTSVKTDTNAITSFIKMITITLVIHHSNDPSPTQTSSSPPPGEDGHKRGRSLPESRQRPPQQEQGPGRGGPGRHHFTWWTGCKTKQDKVNYAVSEREDRVTDLTKLTRMTGCTGMYWAANGLY